MKRTAAILGLALAAIAGARADEMTLLDGNVVTGRFAGFRNHRFVFQERGGQERQEFAVGVRSLRLDPPVKVSAQLLGRKVDDVLFAGYEKYNVRLIRNGREYTEPATMLKQIDMAFDVQRTVESPGVFVISRGEEVDIAKSLQPGRVNVVFFHFPEAHSSVRQGNYVELLTRQSRGQVVVLKLVVPGWDAPVCKARGIESLPQFWFYSPSGRLVRKLTDRFTESDIDDAFKEARRSL